MERKVPSSWYNFFMNFILSASQFLFPLITFPYVSRVLQAEGNGRVDFAIAVANYFMMIASLGIPTYGIRVCAKIRSDKQKLSKTVHELLFINMIMTIITVCLYLICIEFFPRFREDKVLFYINGINIVLNLFGMNWLFQALEQYDYITIRSLILRIISIIMMFLFVHERNDYVIYGATLVFSTAGSNILNFIRARQIVSFNI